MIQYVIGLGLALLLSVGANVWQYFDHIKDKAVAEEAHKGAIAVARESAKLAATNELLNRTQEVADLVSADRENMLANVERMLYRWDDVVEVYADAIVKLPAAACAPGAERQKHFNKALEEINARLAR